MCQFARQTHSNNKQIENYFLVFQVLGCIKTIAMFGHVGAHVPGNRTILPNKNVTTLKPRPEVVGADAQIKALDLVCLITVDRRR